MRARSINARRAARFPRLARHSRTFFVHPRLFDTANVKGQDEREKKDTVDSEATRGTANEAKGADQTTEDKNSTEPR